MNKTTIVVVVDDDDHSPDDETGLTETAYERLTSAIVDAGFELDDVTGGPG